MIKKIIRITTRLLHSLPEDWRVRWLCKHYRSVGSQGKVSATVIGIQGVEDPFFFTLFALLCKELKAVTGCRAELLQIRSINAAIGTDWLAKCRRSLLLCGLMNRQWGNAYANFVGKVAYRSNSLSYPYGDFFDWFRATKLWQTLQGESNIASLTIDDVLVGDLVIDTYLRFRPSPRFDVSDPFVRSVLWQCLREIRRAKKWFGDTRPSLYLSSFSTYVEHGVAARVAISMGVKVYVYGTTAVFGKSLTSEDTFHTANTSLYKQVFENLSEQDECLARADQEICRRLSGEIDAATAYMKISAYATRGEKLPNVRGSVIVFLHDFYDSPHLYPNLVFPDFWSWIELTICTLREAGVPFWIKPHPNQISRSKQALKELCEAYPNLTILDANINNVELVNAGVLCGITVYGTVAHELAYLGIPTIACAKHPHHAFEFCRTATNITEYKAMLRTPELCLLSKSELRRQALAFFYMHNLHGGSEVLEMRNQFVQLWKNCHSEDVTQKEFGSQINKLLSLPGWQAHVDNLIKEIALDVN